MKNELSRRNLVAIIAIGIVILSAYEQIQTGIILNDEPVKPVPIIPHFNSAIALASTSGRITSFPQAIINKLPK
jgi:hypothetical protein